MLLATQESLSANGRMVHFAEERESERDGIPISLSLEFQKKFDTHTLSRTFNKRVSKMFYFHKKLYCVYRTLLLFILFMIHVF